MSEALKSSAGQGRFLSVRRVVTLAVVAAAGLAAFFYGIAEWNGAPAEGSYRLAKAERGESKPRK